MPMRWEDERYVRLYTKDTPSWRMLPWEGRCVLVMLLRAVDRAGVLDLGEDGPEALPVTLMLPEPVCEVGLTALLKRGTVVLNGTCLVIPNFMAAQDTPQSDRARQRAHRERARADALRPERSVTNRDVSDRTPPHCDQASQNVTESHAVTAEVTPDDATSRNVTPSLTVLSLDETRQDKPPARERAIPGGVGPGVYEVLAAFVRTAGKALNLGELIPCLPARHGLDGALPSDLESSWQATLACYQQAQKCDRAEVLKRVERAGEFLASGGFAYWRKETGSVTFRLLCEKRGALFAKLLDEAKGGPIEKPPPKKPKQMECGMDSEYRTFPHRSRAD